MNTQQKLWIGVVLLSILVAVTVLNRINKPLFLAEKATVNPNCDASGFPCEISFNQGGRVRLELSPQPIVAMKPLKVEAIVEGEAALAVDIQMTSTDMSMGTTRIALQSAGDGVYQATTIIPICSNDQMAWLAELHIETSKGLLIAPFKFTSYKQ
jgi:hypothetical protein